MDKFYDLHDKLKKVTNCKTQISSMQYEVINLGTEQNPKNGNVGFHFSVVNRIMGCVTSVNFSIFINGVASFFFKPARELREECIVSPLLFLLVAKVIISKSHLNY